MIPHRPHGRLGLRAKHAHVLHQRDLHPLAAADHVPRAHPHRQVRGGAVTRGATFHDSLAAAQARRSPKPAAAHAPANVRVDAQNLRLQHARAATAAGVHRAHEPILGIGTPQNARSANPPVSEPYIRARLQRGERSILEQFSVAKTPRAAPPPYRPVPGARVGNRRKGQRTGGQRQVIERAGGHASGASRVGAHKPVADSVHHVRQEYPARHGQPSLDRPQFRGIRYDGDRQFERRPAALVGRCHGHRSRAFGEGRRGQHGFAKARRRDARVRIGGHVGKVVAGKVPGKVDAGGGTADAQHRVLWRNRDGRWLLVVIESRTRGFARGDVRVDRRRKPHHECLVGLVRLVVDDVY